MTTKTLNQTLIEEFGRQSVANTHLPLSITSNLNPKFPVREYQEKAFKFFITYYQNSFVGKPRNTQLDFPQYHRHFSMSDLLLFKLNWA